MDDSILFACLGAVFIAVYCVVQYPEKNDSFWGGWWKVRD